MRLILACLMAIPAAALAQDSSQAGGGTSSQPASACLGGGGYMQVIPILAMIAIFYFLIIRPQQKQQKDLRSMRDSLKKDDRIVTTGGIHGSVVAVKGEIISLRIADGVKIDLDRSAIAGIERRQDGESS